MSGNERMETGAEDSTGKVIRVGDFVKVVQSGTVHAVRFGPATYVVSRIGPDQEDYDDNFHFIGFYLERITADATQSLCVSPLTLSHYYTGPLTIVGNIVDNPEMYDKGGKGL